MRWPVAEVEINATLVEDLIRSQHPDLLRGPLREMPPGFDNAIWRLGDDLVVRLPRRHVAVQLIEREQRWLPEMAARLPLMIPAPLRVGTPSDLYPWPWTITRWIDGTPGNHIEPETLRNVTTPLGEFFRALHRDAPRDAPNNPFRDVPLQVHDISVHSRLDELGESVAREEVLRVWEAALAAAAWTAAPQWIHGDPHPANLIVREGELVGVIDFGDLCAGDPATDLAGGLLALPLDSLDRFFTAYGALDVTALRRTLGWAVHFGLMFVLLGESDEPSYGTVGRRALENAIDYSRSLG
jgi:aminoglycoside phosphotransferase (APT) family kinase protein